MKRVLLAAVMTLAVTVALTAQRGRGGPGGFRTDPATALQTALGLTEAQVQAIKALWETEQTRIQAIRDDIQQKRQTLETLLSVASPSAVDVGNAAIALNSSEAQLQTERTSFINQIKQQLTGEQQQKLDALLAERGGRGLSIPGLGPGPRGQR